MRKFYNNPVWNRGRGLRGLGILALSAAFCFAGLLALSSCGDDDEAMTPEPMEMRGFFISVNTDNQTVCSNEDVDVFLEGDESTGKLDVRIISQGEEFGEAEFGHVGSKVIGSEGKTIVTAYVTDDEGSFAHPGSYYLASKTDAAIADETIFTGYWVGHAYRPTAHPVVLCPYVLVPRTALEKTDSGCDGGTDANNVAEGLKPYLAQDDGGNGGMKLRACYNVFDDEGKVSPMQRP